MQRVRGDQCACGQPALSTGRCRSCAARLANETRRENARARAVQDLELLEEHLRGLKAQVQAGLDRVVQVREALR